MQLLNSIPLACCISCTDQRIHSKLLICWGLPNHRLPIVKIFKFCMNCVQDLVHPFHEADSKPILSQCSIYSPLKLSSHQSWFEPHLQNLRIELTKWSKCSILSKSTHTRTQEPRIHSTKSFIFGLDFFLNLIINFGKACIFVQFSGRLKQHDDVKMCLFKHPVHLISHWTLPQAKRQMLKPQLFQNRFLHLIKLTLCVVDKFY